MGYILRSSVFMQLFYTRILVHLFQKTPFARQLCPCCYFCDLFRGGKIFRSSSSYFYDVQAIASPLGVFEFGRSRCTCKSALHCLRLVFRLLKQRGVPSQLSKIYSAQLVYAEELGLEGLCPNFQVES